MYYNTETSFEFIFMKFFSQTNYFVEVTTKYSDVISLQFLSIS